MCFQQSQQAIFKPTPKERKREQRNKPKEINKRRKKETRQTNKENRKKSKTKEEDSVR